MRVATVVSSGKDLTYENGQFLLEGQPVPSDKVVEYDDLGILQWVSPETRTWFQGLRPPPTPAPTPAATAAPARGSVSSQDPRIAPALKGRQQLLIGSILFAVYAVISVVGPVASALTGFDVFVWFTSLGSLAWLVGLVFAAVGFVKVSPILRISGIAKVLIAIGLVIPVIDAAVGFVIWWMAKGAIDSPASMPAEGGQVGWAYGLGRWVGKSNTNRVVAIVGIALLGLLVIGGVVRLGQGLFDGVGPGQAIGTAMPPNEVLVDGKTYIVFENKSGTDNIRRGDRVKVEFKDIDHDGEDDMVDIIELVSVSGQE